MGVGDGGGGGGYGSGGYFCYSTGKMLCEMEVAVLWCCENY